MSREVVAPDGRRWKVRRRWVPRLGTETLWGRFHRRYRQTMDRLSEAADLDPGCLDILGEGIVVALAVIAAVLVAVFVIIPLLVIVVDLMILIVLALLGVLARIAFRRPWTIEAVADDGTRQRWRVAGWKASGAQLDATAERLASGTGLPPGEPPSA